MAAPLSVGALFALPYLTGLFLRFPTRPSVSLTVRETLDDASCARSVSEESGTGRLFTKAHISDRARDWEVRRLESCGWKLMLSERCAVRSDCLIDDVRATGVYADAFVRALDRELEGESADLRFSIRVFRHRHAFDAYAAVSGARGAESFYDVRNAEVVLHAGGGVSWRLLMHELTHAYLDRVFDRRGPLWAMEGMAECFAYYRKGEESLVPGAESAIHEARLRAASERDEIVPLGRLVAYDRDSFYGEDHEVAYAQAWSLVRFLASDTHRPSALKELARGRALEEMWNVQELERKWMASLDRQIGRSPR